MNFPSEYFNNVVSKIKARGDRWPADNKDALFYFENTKFEKIVLDFLHKEKDEGKEVVYVDICGKAVFANNLADCNYRFAVGSDSDMVDPDFTSGNIFDDESFNSFAARFKTQKAKLITLEAGEGLNAASEVAFTKMGLENISEKRREMYKMFLKRLRTISNDMLDTGGYFMLGRSFFTGYAYTGTDIFDEKRLVRLANMFGMRFVSKSGSRYLFRKVR